MVRLNVQNLEPIKLLERYRTMSKRLTANETASDIEMDSAIEAASYATTVSAVSSILFVIKSRIYQCKVKVEYFNAKLLVFHKQIYADKKT